MPGMLVIVSVCHLNSVLLVHVFMIVHRYFKSAGRAVHHTESVVQLHSLSTRNASLTMTFSPSAIPVFNNVLISGARSEEHTSELQSRGHLVCRLLLEKKKYRCARHARY